MDSISIKPHKFFDRYLDNDLDSLFDYLSIKHEEILNGLMPGIPGDILQKYNKYNGAPTQLGQYYNIFNFDNPAIGLLKKALADMIDEASTYYETGYTSKDYFIHGWFNLDYKSGNVGVSPLKNADHFHDHMNGTGVPIFHGYYCVNAEPSSTFYKIGGISGEPFENINYNNRAVLSETGHPHGRDDWYNEKPRITIAYDLAPRKEGENWIEL